MKYFLLPLLVFTFWSLLGCLLSRLFFGTGFHRLFLLFLMAVFGCSLIGRVMVFDFIEYPINILISSFAIVLPVVSGLTWPESEAEVSAPNERLPIFSFGFFALAVVVVSTLNFSALVNDQSVVSDRGMVGFIVGIQIFLVGVAIYFISLFRRA